MINVEIAWSQIDTVLLDMDGTLLDLHYDNYFWRQHLPAIYGKQKNLSPQQALKELEPLFLKYSGTLDWYCVNFWSDKLQLDIMQHKNEVADKIAYRPRAQIFLENCRQHVTDLRLITNAHRKVLNLKIEHTKLDKYFDSLVCSHELNAPKEDLLFWQNLYEMKSFNATRTLFIDDSESVLDAAANYGIGHIYSIEQPDLSCQRVDTSKYQMIKSI